jgi:hypothetical protein
MAADNPVDVNTHRIINLGTPVLDNDSATKEYVDQNAGISQFDADNRYYLNDTPLNNI